MPLNLQIVTAEKTVFNEEVDSLVAPGADGVLGILPRHAPLLSALKAGELRYKRKGEETTLAVGGGFMEVLNNKVIVLADSAERSEEIDIERAQAARQTAEQTLQNRGQLTPETLAAAEASLRRALVRIEVGTRRRNNSRSMPRPGEEL